MSDLRPGKDYIGVGVGAVVLRDGRLLLLLRRKAPEAGCWSIPGGKVEFGETCAHAVLRELSEETGLRGRIVALLGVMDHIVEEEHTHFVSPAFLVEAEGEAGNREEGSHKELGWFDPEELPENLTLTTKKALEGYRRYLADRV